MGFEPVDVFLKTSEPLPRPVSGVVVRVFSQDGKLSWTQEVTDDNGRASFLLPSGATYQVRMFKQHCAFDNPKYLAVLDPPGSNTFDVSVDVVAPPVAQNPRLCVAYGYFRTPTGAPAANVDVHFIAKFRPLLLDGDAVLVERAIVRTDEQGYVQINLIRNGRYDVTVQGSEEYQRQISTPDAPNVNLSDLLFPVVASILFDPPPPYALTVDEEIRLTATVYGTDGVALPDYGDVIWSTSNQDILGVFPAGGFVTLRGISPGTAYLRAVRSDQTIVRIPEFGIVNVPALVTVT